MKSVGIHPDVVSERHYFEKSKILGAYCTVYLLLDSNNDILARGISLCSILDHHKKDEGIKKARSRAIGCFFKKRETDLPINSSRNWSFFITRGFNKKKSENIKEIIEEAVSYQLPAWETEDSIFIRIPNFLPMRLIEETFAFKGYYKPQPTEKELSILKKKEK